MALANLPSNWSSYSPQQKIHYFNENQIDADELIAAGVPQSDIDWMLQNGYMGTSDLTPLQIANTPGIGAGGIGVGGGFGIPGAPNTQPMSLEELYRNVLGREASPEEIESWGFGAGVDAEELDRFLGAARNEAVETRPTTGAVGHIAQQILAQNTSGGWGGEGYGSAEKTAYDMAAMLAAQGITDINQFGEVPSTERTQVQKEYADIEVGDGTQSVETGRYFTVDGDGNKSYVDASKVVAGEVGSGDNTTTGYFFDAPTTTYGNKVTGQPIDPYYSKASGNTWGGTFAGEGSTAYKVQFDENGSPIFYSQYGGSSNDFANLMADLGPVAQIGLAIATGGLSIPQQIAAQMAVQILSGKDLEDAVKAAAVSYAVAQIPGLDAVKEGAEYLKGFDPSGVLSGAFQNAATSATKAALTGGDISDALLSGAVAGGTAGAVNLMANSVDGFKDLTPAQQQIAKNAITSAISGKPLDQVLINSAVALANAEIKTAKDNTAAKEAGWADYATQQAAKLMYGADTTPEVYANKQNTTEDEAKQIAQQLTDAGLVDGSGQFADAGSLTDADIAEIVGGDSPYSSQVQGLVAEALADVGIAQALPNPSMPGYGAALEKAGPALYKVVADAANDPEFLKKLPLLERALNAAGTSVARIIGTGASLATYSPELGANEAELLDRARRSGVVFDVDVAGAGRGVVNPIAPIPSPSPKPTPKPKPEYIVQPGDYTDTTEEVQPWQLVDPISGLPLPSESPEPDIPEPTPEEPLVIPDAPPANDPFINPPATPEEDPFVVPELPPANDPFVEPFETPSQEPEHNPSRPVFVPTQPETWPTPAEDPLFNPYEPVTWPEVNPPPSPLPSPTPAPAPSPSPSPLPSPNPAPSPSPRPNPQPQPAPQPQPQPQPQPAPQPAPQPQPQPAPQPQPQPAPQPQPQPAPQPQPQPQPQPAPQPQPQPAPQPQPQPEPAPEVNPPEVTPPEVKPPAVKVPPKVVQQVALQVGIPATSQIAQDIAEALYSTMDYYDPFGDPFAATNMQIVSRAVPAGQTKMAQGGYLGDLLAENMSVDDLLNLLR